MVLLLAPFDSHTPIPLLARAPVPAALVPIKFPWTKLLDVVPPSICTPAPLLPEMTLLSPVAVPPMVLLVRACPYEYALGVAQRNGLALVCQ